MLSRTAVQALGYRQLLDHLAGRCSLEAAREEILRRTRAFARRQESWFRRDPRVQWLDATDPDLLRAAAALVGRSVSSDQEGTWRGRPG